jgi:hypothetical protein
LPLVLLAATALFVLGVALEPHTEEARGEHVESEGGEHAESEAGEEGTEPQGGEERVLGLDLESPLVVGLAVVASVGLALLAWSRPERRWLVAIAVVAAGFALVDVAEVLHQLDEDRMGLALLAAAVAALHALAAVLAVRATAWPQAASRSSPPRGRRPGSA